ncbi:DUF3892 domain-containing protein [bacterium AH-315-F18]|nr:DUF3892 domain-containing protein [bacterium AH-315-F18]
MEHQITCATRDSSGVVQKIGNSSQNWARLTAVNLINSGTRFFVHEPGTEEAEIRVFDTNFLRTDPDGDLRNNLDELSACAA